METTYTVQIILPDTAPDGLSLNLHTLARKKNEFLSRFFLPETDLVSGVSDNQRYVTLYPVPKRQALPV